MNPFTEEKNDGNYKEHVRSQLLPMAVGESIAADIGWKEKHDFRMNLGQVAKEHSLKFKTATGKDGLLYVKRVK